jgi:hypothetical protein
VTAGKIPIGKMILVSGLSLSIGWGIRGNFGHEYGAMIPGALAAIAAVLMGGREDWWRRVAYFGMFGALGWAFGGSISYMMVIAYTHSGHFPTQVYGFACLFVIGFLWGALGGAGTALPACLDREKLTSIFAPMIAVFFAWTLQDIIVPRIERSEAVKARKPEIVFWSGMTTQPDWLPRLISVERLSELENQLKDSAKYRHESILYWYDSDWIGALLAIVAVLALAAIRWRFCWGTSFILHLAVGWWIGFLLMVLLVDGVGIEFRMTPPRGDNWAGITGMTAGALVYFLRNGLIPVAHAALVAGFFGGFGFATATFLKLVEIKYVPLLLSETFGAGTWQTNWHSILEQSYGFLNGIGIAVAMAYLARRLPRTSDQPRLRPWTEIAAVAFVLVAITYVNIVKNVSNWVQQKAIPADLYSLSSCNWFNIAYGLLAAALILVLIRHLRRPLAMIPSSLLGRGQLLYLVFLWWVVIGNLMRAIPPFPAQRLITEGVIHLNAVLCTVFLILWPGATGMPDREDRPVAAGSLIVVTLVGLLSFAGTVALESYGTRAIHGGEFVGHAGRHKRFGPEAKTGKPAWGKPHP